MPPTSTAPSSVWRSTIASGRPGKTSGGPGSRAATSCVLCATAISGLDLHDEVEERVGDVDELVRDAARDREHVALAEPVRRPALDGGGAELARGDLARLDELAARDDGRGALDDMHDVDEALVVLDLAGHDPSARVEFVAGGVQEETALLELRAEQSAREVGGAVRAAVRAERRCEGVGTGERELPVLLGGGGAADPDRAHPLAARRERDPALERHRA